LSRRRIDRTPRRTSAGPQGDSTLRRAGSDRRRKGRIRQSATRARSASVSTVIAAWRVTFLCRATPGPSSLHRVQEPVAKRPRTWSHHGDWVACSIAECVDEECCQVSGIGDQDWRRGDAPLALPVREHDNSIRLVPCDAEKLIRTERLRQKHAMAPRWLELRHRRIMCPASTHRQGHATSSRSAPVMDGSRVRGTYAACRVPWPMASRRREPRLRRGRGTLVRRPLARARGRCRR
ncbi:MAG: hypothetical protein QOC79_1124, partial [Actinomycetota bacterium]|nr:hypothetical protein [Actinomycetota bacterium]